MVIIRVAIGIIITTGITATTVAGDQAGTEDGLHTMDVDIIAMLAMTIEAVGVEAMTVAAGVEVMMVAAMVEVTPDHVVMGKITISIATTHNAHGSPIPATGNHGQSGMPVIPGGQTTPTPNESATPTQTADGSRDTPAKARAKATGRAQ